MRCVSTYSSENNVPKLEQIWVEFLPSLAVKHLLRAAIFQDFVPLSERLPQPAAAEAARAIDGGAMDVNKMLADLRQERVQIDEAIRSLERLIVGRGRRRGRPPAWLSQVEQPKRRGRPPGSKNKTTGGQPKSAAVA
jgi:hypothetical protein